MTTTQAAPRELRPYQTEAVAAVERDWAEGTKRVGVVLPTGAGKSTVIAKLAVDAYHRGQRVILLAHRAELIDQMTSTVRAVDPSIPAHEVGVVQAEQDDHHAAIVGATLQTLRSARRLKAVGRRDVILWDEVHHAAADGFHTTFNDLGGYGEDALMCGFTATMRRTERGRIGLGDVIEKISYSKDLKWAIENGFLIRPKGLTVRLDDLNALDGIRSVAGDFAQGEMQRVMEAATSYVVDAVKMHASGRRPIIFAASVEAAHAIAAHLNRNDYPAVAVTGQQSFEERQELYTAYRAGFTRALVTVMVLTEGADFPMCDCVVLARPTRSPNLYSQMIGRALRLYEGKTDALVLDLSGSSRQMRLTSLPQILPGVETRVVGGDGRPVIDSDGDAEPEEITEILRPLKPKLRGPVRMVTIDLISGTSGDTLWLETPAGVPFMGLDDGWLIFLWPQGGKRGTENSRYAVGSLNTKTRAGGWVGGTEEYMPLADAVMYAEKAVPEAGFTLPKNRVGWRGGSQPPSEKQIGLARSLGIKGWEDMTKGRLSDEISVVFASRALDAHMTPEEVVDIPGQHDTNH